MEGSASENGALPIPRIVHRVWVGGEEPAWTRPFADTWRRPGWELWEWTDATVRSLFPLRNQSLFDRAEEIAPDHVGQLRSDILRYEILARFGGVYVDADFECLRPIDPLLDGMECFAAWEFEPRWANNAILGATPGHPFIEALVDGLPHNVRRRAGAKPNKLSGPQYLTRVYRGFKRSVTVFPQSLFYPFIWNEVAEYLPGDFDPAEQWPNAYAVHWWANRRRERGLSC